MTKNITINSITVNVVHFIIAVHNDSYYNYDFSPFSSIINTKNLDRKVK